MRTVVTLAVLFQAVSAAAAPPFSAGSAENPYPRLCLRPDQIPQVAARLTRPPYSDLLARVLGRARSAPSTGTDDLADRARSIVAKAAAFIYAFGLGHVDEAERTSLGEKAEQLLAQIVTETGVTGFSNANGVLYGAERLHPWTLAYDFLEAGGFPFARRAEIRDRIATLAGNLLDDFTGRHQLVFRSYNQNHTSKAASAVGMAAIVLDGYEPAATDPRAAWNRPAAWIDWALDRVDLIIADALTTETEGGYTEGPTYYHYTAVQHVPFLRAWHLYGGAHGGFPRALPDGRYVGDLWESDSFRAQQRWLLALRLPDGSLPAFNDATPGVVYFFGLFSDHPDAANLHWAWQTAARAHSDSGLTEEILCSYDDRITAVEPDGPPSRLLPEAGQAVLRTGWGPDDVYFLLQAEHGKTYGGAVTRGGDEIDGTAGHNHADPLSFVLYAFGEYLALDGGYLGWENHDKVKGPEHHNLILVDGHGPREPYLSVPPVTITDGGIVITDPSKEGGWVAGGDGEAYLDEGGDMGPLKWASARTRYSERTSEPVELTRTVALMGGRAVALLDRAAGSLDHEYTWLLHGNAGGTSGGTYEPMAQMGGIWRRPKGSLAAALTSPRGGVTIEPYLDVHDAGGWAERQHQALRWRLQGDSVETAMLLALTRAGEADAVWDRPASNALRARFADGAQAVAARGGVNLTEPVSAQADDLAFFLPSGQALPSALLGRGLGSVGVAGSAFVEAPAPADVSLGWDGATLQALVESPGGLTISLPGAVARTSGVCRIEASDGKAHLAVPPGRQAVIGTIGPVRTNSAPVSLPLDGTALEGQPLLLDGEGSCDPDGDSLAYHWTLVDPSAGGAIASANQARATLTGPPGTYRVALAVSDGTYTDRAEALMKIEPLPPKPPSGGGCSATGVGPVAGTLTLLLLLALGGAFHRRDRRSQSNSQTVTNKSVDN